MAEFKVIGTGTWTQELMAFVTVLSGNVVVNFDTQTVSDDHNVYTFEAIQNR